MDDRSASHSVHVAGPGVRLDSGLGFEGTTTWTATFRDGVYSVVSDPQADTLALAFTAGSPPPPTLCATVTDGAIALRRGDGSALTQLDPGAYAIAVDDSSASDSFVLPLLLGPAAGDPLRHLPRRLRRRPAGVEGADRDDGIGLRDLARRLDPMTAE
ncbi:MAG: hypothetical protein ACRDN6_06780 [Gaiellaceae bacterium]